MFSKPNYRLLFSFIMCLGALALGACATNTPSTPMNCPCCEHMKAGQECCCKDMEHCPCCEKGGMSMKTGMTCNPVKN